jgi:hypothetical protein
VQKRPSFAAFAQRSTAWGVVAFVLLYILSAQLYPGGTYQNRQALGFSWRYNFWCNLLDKHALNGSINNARPLAIFAMAILVATLTVFWYKAPQFIKHNVILGKATRFFGCSAMLLSALLLSTVAHDTAINISCGFGAVAILLLLYALWRSRQHFLLALGILSLLLMGGNIYFYYIAKDLALLALIQKFAFAAFLLWFVAIEHNAVNTSKA